MKRIGPLYILIFCIGSWLSMNSWQGVMFVNLSDYREPSSLRGLRDFSALKGSSLLNAASDQLVEQIIVSPVDEGFEIQLSQFLLRDQSGNKNFACRIGGRPGVFDRVEITLMGYGVSEHGKIPEMVVEAECFSQEDQNSVGQILVQIPMSKITKLNPVDQHLGLFDDTKSSIEMRNMTSVWPTEWRVQKVKYLSANEDGGSMTLDVQAQKRGSATGALTLSWPMESTSQ